MVVGSPFGRGNEDAGEDFRYGGERDADITDKESFMKNMSWLFQAILFSTRRTVEFYQQ